MLSNSSTSSDSGSESGLADVRRGVHEGRSGSVSSAKSGTSGEIYLGCRLPEAELDVCCGI